MTFIKPKNKYNLAINGGLNELIVFKIQFAGFVELIIPG